MALLDTTVLIDLTRSRRSVPRQRAQVYLTDLLRRGDTLYTSRINEAEFRVGPRRSADPVRALAEVEAVLFRCLIFEFDVRAALLFAETKARLLNIGRPSGDPDIQIAAVALASGQTLVTRNPKHFADVPGLLVETY